MDGNSNTTKEQRAKGLRARLDALSRGPSLRTPGMSSSAREAPQAVGKREKGPARQVSPTPIVYRRDLPRRDAPPPDSGENKRSEVSLEEAVNGRVVHSSGGKAFVISSRVDDLEGAELFSRTFVERMCADESALCRRVASACGLETVTPHDIIFTDIETTGLGISPLFLIGTMVWETNGFEVRQHLARTYAEEPGVIALFIETCAAKKLLVTFNGKSFDLPFIRTRAAANGIPFGMRSAHFDLLHECRRIWKHVLPDCRLKTLEALVCNRPRYGDISGEEIPDAYHAYVRTEDATQIVEILRHNMLDLVTLADLMTRFPRH